MNIKMCDNRHCRKTYSTHEMSGYEDRPPIRFQLGVNYGTRLMPNDRMTIPAPHVSFSDFCSLACLRTYLEESEAMWAPKTPK